MEVDNNEPENSLCDDWNCNAPGDEEFTHNCSPQKSISDKKTVKKPFTFEVEQDEQDEDKDITDTSHEETDGDDDNDDDYRPQQERRKVTSTPKPAAATPKPKSKGLWTEQKLQLLCTLWEDEQFLYDASHPDYRLLLNRLLLY